MTFLGQQTTLNGQERTHPHLLFPSVLYFITQPSMCYGRRSLPITQLTHKRHKSKSCYQISISVTKEQTTCFFTSLLKNCRSKKGDGKSL